MNQKIFTHSEQPSERICRDLRGLEVKQYKNKNNKLFQKMKLFVVLFYYPDDDGGGYIEEYHSVHDVLENAREIVKKSIEEEKEKTMN